MMLQNPPNCLFSKQNNSFLVMRNFPVHKGIGSKILSLTSHDNRGTLTSITIDHLNLVKVLAERTFVVWAAAVVVEKKSRKTWAKFVEPNWRLDEESDYWGAKKLRGKHLPPSGILIILVLIISAIWWHSEY